jgi:hypothetical protein
VNFHYDNNSIAEVQYYATKRLRPQQSFLLLLYAQRHRSISGATGHIILTPANHLMVMGLKIWSLSNPGFEPAIFYNKEEDE